jgi:hypothetical protein
LGGKQQQQQEEASWGRTIAGGFFELKNERRTRRGKETSSSWTWTGKEKLKGHTGRS